MSLAQNRERYMEQSDGVRQPIRVLIIDRSILTLHGIKEFFSGSQHIEIIGMAGTRLESLQTIQVEQPDLVLMEVRVGQDSGIDLCKTIRQRHPQVRVLFFTTQDDKDTLRAAIMAGAHGYLLKSATADSITKSLEIVASGAAIMDQHLTEQVIHWLRDSSSSGYEQWEKPCSKEERHLLSLVASGKTNKEIGQELNIAHTVVASRLQKIYKRLRISRRAEAVWHYINLEQKQQN
ncbi:MAG: response regulator transcription factor [Nitrospira sp.]|nr:response regulator transcription factor [Nitrospira sp.]